MRSLRLLLMGAALAFLALLAPAGRAEAVQVTEFPLPVAESSPLGIALGADGNLWFVEVSGSRFGRITPAGAITDFSTGSGISAGAEPWGIAAADDGGLWFTEQVGNRVGRINPLTRQATEFSAGITSPSGPRGITAGPDGNVWFAEDGGRIGRITPAGVVTEFSAGITPGSRPLGDHPRPGRQPLVHGAAGRHRADHPGGGGHRVHRRHHAQLASPRGSPSAPTTTSGSPS